jgi:DNA-binding FrmR family transcriptional regulator
MDNRHQDHKETLNHINRIQGQIGTLKKYVEENRTCEEISSLATSIAKSFDTLRTQTLRKFIKYDLLEGKAFSEKRLEQLDKLLNLHKK